MMVHLKIAAATSAALLAISAAYGQTSSSPAAAGDAERGAVLYRQVGCYQCHGLAAHGGVAPQLGPNPHPAIVIAAYIRHPTGVMPPYSQSVLSDRDVADITAWLRTLPASPEPSSIEILPDLEVIEDAG